MQTQTEKPPANLVEKLAAVMAQVERVPKNGWNDFHKYHYATEADITDAVRAAMARFGVMLIPSVDKTEWREVQTKNGSEKIASLTVRFTATDGKDKIEFIVIGEGQDRGDKATYKAMTGATKYALLKLFLIPTGDDPETEEDEHPHTGSRQAPRQQAAHQPAPAPSTTSGPPPFVAALWTRLKKERGTKELADVAWKKAAADAKVPPDTSKWTKEDAAKVEAELWPRDVP